jgi:predicted HicB family RNase H-like nuclease
MQVFIIKNMVFIVCLPSDFPRPSTTKLRMKLHMLLQCYPCVEILYGLRKNCKKEANILFGNIIGIRDTVGFHGESVGELKDALQEAIDFYLEGCEKAGREPNKPFSGKFVVRVDSSLHGEIAAAAVHAE